MYYIGIDLGGTMIKAGLVDMNNEIIKSLAVPTKNERSAQEIVEDMAQLCRKLMEEQGIEDEQIHSIGIGCPGIVKSDEGIVLSSSNLNFENMNVRAMFKKHFNIPVYIENDANCAALGETLAGAAKGADSALVITFGTGVGGGLILRGKIHTGAYFGAGEIGHQVINIHEERKCGCGRRGCYEQYASASALVRMAEEAVKKEPGSLMIKLAQQDKSGCINGRIIFEAAKSNDQTALRVLDEYYYYAACGAANLINILEPEVLVLGGGISAQGEYITKPIRNCIQEQMYGGLSLKTSVKAAELGNDAGIIGAALLGIAAC